MRWVSVCVSGDDRAWRWRVRSGRMSPTRHDACARVGAARCASSARSGCDARRAMDSDRRGLVPDRTKPANPGSRNAPKREPAICRRRAFVRSLRSRRPSRQRLAGDAPVLPPTCTRPCLAPSRDDSRRASARATARVSGTRPQSHRRSYRLHALGIVRRSCRRTHVPVDADTACASYRGVRLRHRHRRRPDAQPGATGEADRMQDGGRRAARRRAGE